MLKVQRRPKRKPRKLRLTDLTVRKAKPEPKTYLVWDSKQPNLALRVQPSGHRAWVCIYSRSGRARWLSLGNAAAVGLADARTMAAEAILQVAKGGDPAADRRAERGSGTFGELHARYLEEHARKRNRSWAQADALIRRHVLARWGKLPAKSISRRDVKALLAKIDGPIAANQVLAAISAVFTWAAAEDLVGANPCRGVPRNATTSRERILADSEIPRFWKALDQIEPVKAAALRMILVTGQRPGEVAHMRVEHYAAADGWWLLLGSPAPTLGWPGTKNGESHRVWLSQAAQAIVAAVRDSKDATTVGFLFGAERGGAVHSLDKAAREACAIAGIADKVTPHDLRRTFGSMVTAAGFGRPAMDRLLNHTDRSVGSVYDRHAYLDENRHIWESVAAKIMGLVEGPTADDTVVQLTLHR